MKDKLLGKILYYAAIGQFFIVMIFANQHTLDVRLNDVTTFYGYPIWVSFAVVGVSALIAIIAGTKGYLLMKKK